MKVLGISDSELEELMQPSQLTIGYCIALCAVHYKITALVSDFGPVGSDSKDWHRREALIDLQHYLTSTLSVSSLRAAKEKENDANIRQDAL